jgi:hemerythrin-like domain-containing protein
LNPFDADAPGFDRPLDLLAACHERILARCATLEKLAAHAKANGADEPARQAARAVLRYFDEAAPLHHADEEQNLFVLIEGACGTCAFDLCDFLEGLETEHEVMAGLWTQLRAPLLRLAKGESADLPEAVLGRFVQMNREHVAFENERLLPLARRVLDAAALARLGAAMAARRGVVIPAQA